MEQNSTDFDNLKVAESNIMHLCEIHNSQRIRTKKDKICALSKQILEARQRGIAWADIASAITDAGITVSDAYLRNTITATQKKSKKIITKTKQMQQPAAPVAPPAAPLLAPARESGRMKEPVDQLVFSTQR